MLNWTWVWVVCWPVPGYSVLLCTWVWGVCWTVAGLAGAPCSGRKHCCSRCRCPLWCWCCWRSSSSPSYSHPADPSDEDNGGERVNGTVPRGFFTIIVIRHKFIMKVLIKVVFIIVILFTIVTVSFLTIIDIWNKSTKKFLIKVVFVTVCLTNEGEHYM